MVTYSITNCILDVASSTATSSCFLVKNARMFNSQLIAEFNYVVKNLAHYEFLIIIVYGHLMIIDLWNYNQYTTVPPLTLVSDYFGRK